MEHNMGRWHGYSQQASVMSNTCSNTISAIVSQVGVRLKFVTIVHTGNTGNTAKMLLCKRKMIVSTSWQMHYNKEFHLPPHIYLYSYYKCFTKDLSNRLCMGSWLGSAHSSGSASTAKMSKSGTNSPNMQFRGSWVGSQLNSSKYLRSSCCLLCWHLTVWWLFWRSYFHRVHLPFILDTQPPEYQCCYTK